ncbi:MAG: hypothetical protein KGL39_56390 [Patescibacteria group bacterium]|nr:hypothetical protein [Patescibacteria group bacterium]
MGTILPFVRPAPKVQDPWVDVAREMQRNLRAMIAIHCALIGGTLLGIAAELGALK